MNIDELELPMYNEEAEKGLISCLLTNQDTYFDTVKVGLEPYMIYIEKYRELFKKAASLINNDRDITVASLAEECDMSTHKLCEIASFVAIPTLVTEYSHIIKENYLKRKTKKIAQETIYKLKDNKNASNILDNLHQKINNIYIENGNESNGMTNLLIDRLEQYGEILDWQELANIKTGWLDEELNGWLKPGQLIYFWGRPGQGKTAFAMNMMDKIAENNQVLFFSIEMTTQSLTDRYISMKYRIPMGKLSRGDISVEDYSKVSEGISSLDHSDNLNITFEPGATIKDIERQILINDPDIVFIDYLQLLNYTGKYQNKTQQVGELSRQLKKLAGEYNIPIVCLTQLNRSVENRTDKHPRLSDLRDTGSLEQDADIVLFIYREKYYDKDCGHDLAEIQISKHRNWETGKVCFEFIPQFLLFGTEPKQLQDTFSL